MLLYRLGRTRCPFYKPLLILRPCILHDGAEIIALTLHGLQNITLERHDSSFMQVFELAEEEWSKGSVELSKEVGSLGLVNASMISGSFTVESHYNTNNRGAGCIDLPLSGNTSLTHPELHLAMHPWTSPLAQPPSHSRWAFEPV